VHSVRVKRAVLVVALLGGILPASALAWGGRYPTGDAYGSTVEISVSDTYPVDEALAQEWATFFGSLVHGRELASLTVDLAPLEEVQTVCGPQALACYDPNSQTIEASPEDQLNAPAAKEIVTHEYGHHVANNSLNAPFDAEEYGTKRWASYMNICKRAVAGELFPGDEGDNYQENPGEGYAEAYRVLNLTKQGATSIGWDIVDPALYPNATALSMLEQDITTPWTGPTLSHVRGSFGNGSVRTIVTKTTLDGSFVARLHTPAKSRMRLQLYAAGRLVASGSSVRYQICGQRALTLKVQRVSGRGAFTVDVSKP
jgi:hypothetical protein